MVDSKTQKNILFCVGFVFILLSILTRFYLLTEKPLHFDEGINGWFSMKMTEIGFYKYDPENYHGPLYFYLLHWAEGIFGVSLVTLRLIPALFDMTAISLFVIAGLTIQITYLWLAAILLLSPAFIFFSRSGIHEIPFVFFQLLFAFGFTEWIKRPSQKVMLFFVMGFWGMILLKETFSISLLSFFAAALFMGPTFWRKYFSWSVVRPYIDRSFFRFTFLLFVFFVFFFTGFLKNPGGFFDFFRAFMPWLKTGAEGSGHEKEFLYWIKVLWEAEPLVLLCLVLAVFGVMQSSSQIIRFWSAYGIVQFLFYSLIPYKTVWCVASIIWPLYWVCSCYLQELNGWKKILLLALSSICVIIGLHSLWRSSYQQPIDLEHPYVYVNSTYLAKDIQNYIQEQIALHPNLASIPIQMGMSEQWPWPWVLRSFNQVSYMPCAKQIVSDSTIYFCEEPESAYVERLFSEAYWKVRGTLRQTRLPSVIYFKRSVFLEAPSVDAILVSH